MLALALGKTVRELLTGEPGMDAAELGQWQRFYRRHPFGLIRGDYQAWLVARNVAEVFGSGLRPLDRAALGLTKHKPRTVKSPIKTDVTAGALKDLAAAIGCEFVPGDLARHREE